MPGRKNTDEAKIKFTAETAEMQDDIKKAERVLKELRSELRLNAEQMKTTGEDAESLEKQYQILQSESEQYERKLDALNGQLESAVAIWGENSQEAENLRIKINNAGTAYEKVKQQTAKAKAELEQFRQEMEESGKEAEDTRSAYEKLTDTISEQESELSGLEEAYKDAILQYGRGSAEAEELEDKMQRLSRELNDNRDTMDNLEKAAKDASGQMDDLADSAKDVDDGFTVAKGAIATFVGDSLSSLVGLAKDGASAIYNLADETRGYRSEMSKLSSSAESSGYSADYAKEKYMDLYSVLADETAANTTVSNFMAMKLSQEDLDTVLNASIGIWAKYGDSIPLDGLAESVNETANAGQVTGNLADALNWAGISEDDFNLRLQTCNTTQERQAMIVDTLDSTYGNLADAYKKNNKRVLDANRATAEYNDVMAELGEEMEPVTLAIREGMAEVVKSVMELVDADADKAAEKIGDAFEWIADNMETIVKVAGVGAGAITAMFAVNKAAQFTDSIKKLVSNFVALRTATVTQTTAQAGLNTVMNANPVGAIVLSVGALVTAFEGLAILHDQYMADLEEEIEKTWGLTEEQEKLVTSIKDRRQAIEEAEESRERTISGIEQEYGYYERLAEELQGLVDANGRIIEGNEERAELITTILADALGLEIEITDGVIQNYEDLNSSIEKVIETKKAEAILSQYESSYTEAIQNQRDAFNELTQSREDLQQQSEKTAEAERQLKEAQEELAEAEQKYIQSGGNYGEYALDEAMKKADTAKMAYETALESQREMTQAVKDAEESWTNYNTTIQNYEGFQSAIISGDIDAVNIAMSKLINGFTTAEQGTRESLERQVDNARAYYESLKQEIENGTPGVTQEMVDSAAEFVKATEDELKKLPAGEITKEKMQEAADEIVASKYQAGEAAADVAKEIDSKFRAFDFKSTGYNAVAGIGEGARSYDIGSIGAGIGSALLGSVKNVLQIKSPSKAMYEIGTYFTEGFTDSVNDHMGLVKRAATGMADEAMNPFRKLSPDDLQGTLDGSVNMHMSMMEGYVNKALSENQIDYDRMGEIFLRAVSSIDCKIVISEREFSRIVQEVM